MRIHDWTGFASLPAIVMTIVELARGDGASALGWAIAALLLGVATRYLALRFPSPMPHLLRWSLLVPRTNQSPAHLCDFLEPHDGERILEVGPGLGIHSVAVASALAPTGELDIVDVQQKMLAEVLQRANKANLTNIVAELGDAQRLPYPDNTFDAAYLLGVLGEIPNGQLALQEVRRVLKLTGRLVVGEVIFDPDCVLFGELKRQTEQAGFVFDQRLGGALSYLARFRPTAQGQAAGRS
jgi:SAM-dependent methyltransferase